MKYTLIYKLLGIFLLLSLFGCYTYFARILDKQNVEYKKENYKSCFQALYNSVLPQTCEIVTFYRTVRLNLALKLIVYCAEVKGDPKKVTQLPKQF